MARAVPLFLLFQFISIAPFICYFSFQLIAGDLTIHSLRVKDQVRLILRISLILAQLAIHLRIHVILLVLRSSISKACYLLPIRRELFVSSRKIETLQNFVPSNRPSTKYYKKGNSINAASRLIWFHFSNLSSVAL